LKIQRNDEKFAEIQKSIASPAEKLTSRVIVPLQGQMEVGVDPLGRLESCPPDALFIFNFVTNCAYQDRFKFGAPVAVDPELYFLAVDLRIDHSGFVPDPHPRSAPSER
jgi:hypothetical protein